MKNFGNRNAFTLVELAIVIIIIGLLVGGVLAGQELVKQAKIQALVKNVESYKTATYTYKSKYGDLAGDSNKHSKFFPGAGIVEGNNTGRIDWIPETFEFWRALGLSKLIKGTYNGYQSTSYVGVNSMPRDNANHNYIYKCTPDLAGTFTVFQKNSCWFYVNMYDPSLTVSNSGYGIFNPQDMRAIDLKYDDGIPSSGKILAIRTAANNSAGICTDYNASGPVSAANYIDSSTDSLECQPMFEFLP